MAVKPRPPAANLLPTHDSYFGVRGIDTPILNEFFLSYPDKSTYTFNARGDIIDFKPGTAQSKRLDDVKVAEDAHKLLQNPAFQEQEFARLKKRYPELNASALNVFKNTIAKTHSIDDAPWPAATLKNGTKLEAYFGHTVGEGNSKLTELFVRYPDKSVFSFNNKGQVFSYDPGRNKGKPLPDSKVAKDAAELLRHPAFQKQELDRLHKREPALTLKNILGYADTLHQPAQQLRRAP